MLWLIELPDLDADVGPDVKIHMIAAVENISNLVILLPTKQASGGFYILNSVLCKA